MKKRGAKVGPPPVRERARAIRPVSIPPILLGSRLQGFYSQLGYHSVRMAIADGRVSTSGAGRAHQQFSRDQLHNQAREFSRDNGLYQGIIEKGVVFLVGSGFGMQSKSEDERWRDEVEAWWKTWTEDDPEVSGLRCWFQVEELVAKEVLTVGDTGVILTDQDKLQLVEAEQIRGKSFRSDGLVRNSRGLVTGFTVCPYTVDGMLDEKNLTEFKREHLLFLSRPDRPSSWRAVPPLQAGFSMMHRVNDYLDSEALAAQINARLTMIVSKKDAGQGALQTSDQEEGKDPSQPHVTDRVQDWDRGTVFYGEPGEDVKGVERTVPGHDFPQTVTTFIRLLGVPIGIPLEHILMDWTKSNYSQSRAVLEQAHQSFIKWQMLLEKRFYLPVWKWVIDMGIRNGVLKNPPADLYALECIKPAYPWIDQLQEAKAYGEQVDRGFTTLASVLKSKNKDIDDVRNSRKNEVLKAIDISDEIFKEKKVRVPWQHFAGLPASVNAGVVESEPAAEQKPGADKDKDEDGDESAGATGGPRGPKTPKGPLKTITVITERDEKGRIKATEQRHVYGETA
jgi:capsid protein